MKTARALALVWGTALLMEAMVNVPREYNPELPIHYSRDLLVIIAMVVAAARLRVAAIVAGVGSAVWLVALFYEWVRSIGITAMSQEPLLYDAYFLIGHLYTLMDDLLGSKAALMFTGVVVALFAITGLTAWLFRRIQRQLAEVSIGVQCVAVLLLIGAGWGVESQGVAEGQNSLMDLADNIDRSKTVQAEISRGISPNAYKKIRKLKLQKRPSVHIYIVESYGNGIRRNSIREGYYDLLKGYQDRLTENGWKMRTGLSEAPVMGGRSWLADATLLSGRLVKYESVYRHLLPELSSIMTVPQFFSQQGYTTVLMRHNDRARPGLPIDNSYDFDRTVFHADVNYKGRPYGWAGVPDQYALGHLRDEVLPQVNEAPHFVFVHLASSHIPWDEVPPMLDDWRAHNIDYQGVEAKEVDSEEKKRQIKNQLKRFKRNDDVRLRRLQPSEDNIDDYLQIITYSMDAVIDHVLDLENPPDMVIVAGDHQPPLYRRNTDFTVPMHVLVRDGALLREFRERGFRRGMRPPKYENRILHEAFLSVLVRAIARSQDVKMPPYRSHGTRKAPSKSQKKDVKQ